MAVVLDCSAPIDGAAVAACHAAGVMRYVSRFAGPKLLHADELRGLLGAGVAVGLVHEDTADDMTGGAAAGHQAAAVALYELAKVWDAAGLGDPSGTMMGVYAADDHNGTVRPGVPEFMVAYAGDIRAHGLRPGYYGNETSAAFLLGVGVVDLGWGVSTWGADVLGRCHLRQEANLPQLNIGGVICDVNTALAADWGQYPRP